MRILKKLNNRGFGHIEALVVIVALVIIGGAYALITNTHADTINTAGGTLETKKVVLGDGATFTMTACHNNNQIVAKISVPADAGPGTTTHPIGPLRVEKMVNGKPVLVNNKPVYITSPQVVGPSVLPSAGSGYNPLAYYQINGLGALYTRDNWNSHPSLSTISFSFSNKYQSTKIKTFNLGVLGYINGTKLHPYKTFTVGLLATCAS